MKLTIAQIEIPGPKRRARTLVLDGSLGPVDGLAFGVEQRGEIEWIPGSPVAVVHLNGPEETPTEARFRWLGRAFRVGEAMLDGQALLDIDSVVDALSDMVRDTALVDVTWRGRTQTAYLQRFEPEEGKAGEVDASLAFAWVKGPNAQRTPAARPRSPTSFAARVEAAFDATLGLAEADVTFARGVVDDVAQGVAVVRGTIKRLGTAAASVFNVAQDAVGVTRAVAATIQELFTATALIEEAFATSADALSQADDAFMQIRARRYRTTQLRAARQARYQAALERAAYRAETDFLAIHTGVDGDTIWSVARLWYGDAALGPILARRNNLISSVIRPGQRIAIPRRSEEAA